MKTRHLNWLAILSLLPLLLEMPYVFRAMDSSPLESRNLIFLLLAVAQVAYALYARYMGGTLKLSGKPNAAGVIFILCSLACLAFGWHRHIHLAVLFSSICLIWSSLYTICNWPTACALLPACAMFMLGVPSTGFMLGNATGMNGLTVKAILAVVFLGLTPLLAGRYCPRPGTLLYSCACMAIVASYGMKMTTGRLAPALILQCNVLSADGFDGTNMEITAGDRAFYGASDIRRYLFSDAAGNAVHVLEVANAADVHAIHPMAYCLRVSGVTLESEQTIAITVGGREAFVHEIISSHGSRRSLHWQWHSTSELSTADFLLFRSIYSPADDWHTMQLYTALNGTAEESRMLLRQFVEAFQTVKR